MKNSEEFIKYFNMIEVAMKKIVKKSKYMGFKKLIYNGSKINSAIRNNLKDLEQIRILRNAIVHNSKGDTIIAEPNNALIENIKEIHEKITKPAIPDELLSHNVLTIEDTSSLSKALELMDQNKFSQIPVYNEVNFKGMIDSELITFWLANNRESQIDYKEIIIRDILNFQSDNSKIIFRHKEATVYDVLEDFRDQLETDKRLQAIIITENGLKNEKPSTIITEYDIPLLMKYQ